MTKKEKNLKPEDLEYFKSQPYHRRKYLLKDPCFPSIESPKCVKMMVKDNPWMLEKGGDKYVKGVVGNKSLLHGEIKKKKKKITKKLYPKITRKRSKVNKTKERKQRYYNRKKKRTTRKSRAPTEEVYLEYRDGQSNKFWRISKSGSKIKTSWGKIGTSGSSVEKDYGTKSDSEYKKLISSKKKKGYKEKDGGGGLDGYNRELESLWKDLSDTKKLVFIMKDKSYQIMKTNREKYESKIEDGNNDPDVVAILTAGNSYDGYIHLYAKAQNKSVDEVLKNYKKYWKHPMDNKLLIC
jgi:predicted DNA-binding WGR domain protein